MPAELAMESIMTIEVKVPVLPESVEDATIAGWHKKPGDTIRRDENLVDLETDKVVLEVPAPVDGTVKEIRAQEGDTVNSDDVIAIIEEGVVEARRREVRAGTKRGAGHVQPRNKRRMHPNSALRHGGSPRKKRSTRAAWKAPDAADESPRAM